MDGKMEILVRLLGSTHSIWVPQRNWGGDFSRNLWFARQRFRRFGCKWSSGTANNAEQQQAHRDLAKLAADGLVTTAKPRGAKTLFARLTDAGESRALALVGLPSIADALDTMRKLQSFFQHPETTASGDFCPEWLLAGFDLDRPPEKTVWQQTLLDLAETLLPALVRELVESTSNMRRNAWYRLTETGRAILDQNECPTVFKTQPEAPDEAIASYCERRAATKTEIHAAAEEKSEIGYIPISCSPTTRRALAEREPRETARV